MPYSYLCQSITFPARLRSYIDHAQRQYECEGVYQIHEERYGRHCCEPSRHVVYSSPYPSFKAVLQFSLDSLHYHIEKKKHTDEEQERPHILTGG